MRFLLICWAVLLCHGYPLQCRAAGTAQHVVVVVWDGMRPDFVREDLTPTLCRLARAGVTFQNHHSQFPSVTQVSGVAIATGSYPAHSGVVGNVEFRPLIDPRKPVETGVFPTVRKGEEVARGRYLQRPTMAGIVRGAGRRTSVAGSKPALLLDRGARPETSGNLNLFAGRTLPEGALNRVTKLLGEFPRTGATKIERDNWTVSGLIGPVWGGVVPEFTMLWLSEPDFSQHEHGPGSETALSAIRNSDQNLARVLSALEAKGVREQTDILILSDHGVSTVERAVDVAAVLKQAGFRAARQWDTAPGRGDVLVVGDGGGVFFYVAGHDAETTRRLVTFLQGADFTGVIFSRQHLEGTFSLKQARIDSAEAPDVAISMRWTSEKNEVGLPGMEFCDLAEPTPSKGEHGTTSRHDLHNLLIATGPDFRRGLSSDLPSGSVDVAPTVLWILGLKPPVPMDGRVLTEGLSIKGPKLKAPGTKRLNATRDLGTTTWRQYLEISELNGVTYIHEGNGRAESKPPKP